MNPPITKGLAQLGIFLLLALGLPALVPFHQQADVNSSREAISIDEQQKRLEKEKPRMVIIGDSMVPCRVDKDVLSRELGTPVSLLSFDGSASASWFLLFKNIVAEMENPPGQVVIFFRDIYFHMPRYRTTGQRLALIESVSLGAEPELESTLTGDPAAGNPILDPADDILDAAWKIDGYRDFASEKVREAAMKFSRLETGTGQRRAFMDEVFSLKNLRRDLAADIAELQDGREHANSAFPVWSTNPLETFLPHIEKVAKEKGIQLIFYRVKQRRHTREGENDPPELKAYLGGFREWAKNSGHLFADESLDPAILDQHFADGDHTRDEERPFVSTRVAATLKAVLPASGPGEEK